MRTRKFHPSRTGRIMPFDPAASADLAIACIGDLLDYDLHVLLDSTGTVDGRRETT